MKRTAVRFMVLTLTFTLLQCSPTEKREKVRKSEISTSPYLATYAGGYTIEVKGLGNTGDAELYILADNGKAQWMHLKTQGRKEPEIMTRKYGTWSADDFYLKITIDGNSGPIVEEYEMKAGVFYNKTEPYRYLKRTSK